MKTDYCNCNKQLAYVPSTLTVRSFTNVGIDSWIAPAYVNSVEYLVVGGGGGGGGHLTPVLPVAEEVGWCCLEH
jgi:hypothetical protein